MRTRAWYDNNRWRLKKGLPEGRPSIFFSYEEIRDRVGNSTFEELRINRLIMGAYRYGKIEPNSTYDFTQALKNKLERYEETHNLELLLDIANYAMLEFTKPKYFDARFISEDDIEHAPIKKNGTRL